MNDEKYEKAGKDRLAYYERKGILKSEMITFAAEDIASEACKLGLTELGEKSVMEIWDELWRRDNSALTSALYIAGSERVRGRVIQEAIQVNMEAIMVVQHVENAADSVELALKQAYLYRQSPQLRRAVRRLDGDTQQLISIFLKPGKVVKECWLLDNNGKRQLIRFLEEDADGQAR